MFKNFIGIVMNFTKMIGWLIVATALYPVLVVVRIIRGVFRVVMFIAKVAATLVVFALAFPLSLVSRRLGFLAFVVVEGVTRGYIVAKEEISIGARVARRLKIERPER